MPPRPGQRPALDRALPGDHLPGSSRFPVRPELWHVLFRDGEWRPVHVRAWARDVHGRQTMAIEYRVDGDGTYGGTYVVDRARVRPFE